MADLKLPVEPFRIKVVEPIRKISKKERQECLRKAEEVLVCRESDSRTR